MGIQIFNYLKLTGQWIINKTMDSKRQITEVRG